MNQEIVPSTKASVSCFLINKRVIIADGASFDVFTHVLSHAALPWVCVCFCSQIRDLLSVKKIPNQIIPFNKILSLNFATKLK